MSKLLRFFVPLAFCGIITLTAFSGEDEIDSMEVVGGLSFRDQVDVTLVNLDVFVRDKDGSPVTGLGSDDFVLRQDGVFYDVTNFAAFTEEVVQEILTIAQATGGLPQAPGAPLPTQTAASSDPTAEPPEPQPSKRPNVKDIQPVSIVLYVDNEYIRPLDRTRVLRQVRAYIDQVMLPHVQVMVISAQRSLHVLQPFTNDPKLVRDALRSMGRLSGAQIERDSQRREILREMQSFSDATRDDRDGAYRRANALQGDVRSYGEQIVQDIDASVSMMRETALMLAGLPGRKVMVHVSSGIPMVASKDLVHELGNLFQRGSTLPMLTRFDRSRAYRSLVATANAQGLTMYTIDATGLSGDAGGVSAEHSRPVDPMITAMHVNNLQETLLVLAEGTGGRAVLDSNDVTDGLTELREDLFTYYSLGYTVNASGGDVVHRLQVEVPAHPDYEILHRRTYVEKSRETEVQDKVASSLVLNVENNPMEISIEVGAAQPASEERWMVPLEVALPIKNIALLPIDGEYVGQAIVFVTSRNEDGHQSDLQRRAVDLRFPADEFEQNDGRDTVIELGLLMKAGRHRIAVGVLDPVTRQASYTTAACRIQ